MRLSYRQLPKPVGDFLEFTLQIAHGTKLLACTSGYNGMLPDTRLWLAEPDHASATSMARTFYLIRTGGTIPDGAKLVGSYREDHVYVFLFVRMPSV